MLMITSGRTRECCQFAKLLGNNNLHFEIRSIIVGLKVFQWHLRSKMETDGSIGTNVSKSFSTELLGYHLTKIIDDVNKLRNSLKHNNYL